SNVVFLGATDNEIHSSKELRPVLQVQLLILGPKATRPKPHKWNSCAAETSQVIERRGIVLVLQQLAEKSGVVGADSQIRAAFPHEDAVFHVQSLWRGVTGRAGRRGDRQDNGDQTSRYHHAGV